MLILDYGNEIVCRMKMDRKYIQCTVFFSHLKMRFSVKTTKCVIYHIFKKRKLNSKQNQLVLIQNKLLLNRSFATLI